MRDLVSLQEVHRQVVVWTTETDLRAVILRR